MHSDCSDGGDAVVCSSPYYIPPLCTTRTILLQDPLLLSPLLSSSSGFVCVSSKDTITAICASECIHGTCYGDPLVNAAPTCLCSSSQWTGPDCSVGICGGSPPCSGAAHGVCNSTGAVPFCSCNRNFTGSECQIRTYLQLSPLSALFIHLLSAICDPPCNIGTQTCSGFLNTPVCVDLPVVTPSPVSTLTNSPSVTPICDTQNFGGPSCTTPICNGNSQLSCSGQGLCLISSLPHVCSCVSGFSGVDCETALCSPSCVNGKCTAATGVPLCECFSGWTGTDCSSDSIIAIQNNTVTATAASTHKKKDTTIRTIAIVVGCVLIVLIGIGLVLTWKFHRQILSVTGSKPDDYVEMRNTN